MRVGVLNGRILIVVSRAGLWIRVKPNVENPRVGVVDGDPDLCSIGVPQYVWKYQVDGTGILGQVLCLPENSKQ